MKTINANDIVAKLLPITGGTVSTMRADEAAADTLVEGVTEVRLWSSKDRAIMNLVVANDQPLTVKQLVRALQCGYIVSAAAATRFGPHKGMVGAHVAQGCRISTGNMPHDVEFKPDWRVSVSDGMLLDGYDAAINDNGRLDVMLKVGG